MNFQRILFYNIHVAPSLRKSMNLEKFGNSYKAQPNGSALEIFVDYCGGVTSHYRQPTNQTTKTSSLNSPKRFLSRKGKEENTKSYAFSFFKSVLFLHSVFTIILSGLIISKVFFSYTAFLKYTQVTVHFLTSFTKFFSNISTNSYTSSTTSFTSLHEYIDFLGLPKDYIKEKTK